MSLPERINVIRTITYYVPDIVVSLNDLGEEDITTETVMDYIQDWVYEDMASPVSRHDLVYQDENGEEL